MSLRWKAFLLLLSVLALVHAGLAYNGYANMYAQYERQALDEFQRNRALLTALFEQATHDAQEQARALAAVASIEELPWVGELFFGFATVRYYDDGGRMLAQWRLSDLPVDAPLRDREAAMVASAMASGKTQTQVGCTDRCALQSVLPAFERGGRKIWVAISYLLDDTLARFERLSGAHAGLTLPAADSADGWLHGRRLAAAPEHDALIQLLREARDVAPAGSGIEEVRSGEQTLMIAFQALPVPTAGDVQALMAVDQTDELASIGLDQRNYIAFAIFGLLIATAALFILLTPSLRRLAQITDGLPLLAEQRFAEARALFARAARRGSRLNDEIDRLNEGALALADRLQELMGAEAASEAKTQFLAAMSHEIRTPINGLLGLLELHAEGELSDSQRESVRIMRDSALTLLAVVDDILDFSKVEAGKIEVHPVPMGLRDAIEGALETMAASAASKGLRLLCYVQPELPAQVRADPVRLRQVLLNLCSNAIKFTASGQVAVALESADPQADPVRIRCTVRDTGIGIAPESGARLFKPFTQAEASTSRSYGGTGLGLSISRGLIETMGGSMGFSSKLGEGSEFWFQLDCPVVEPASPPLPPLEGIAARIEVSDAGERAHLQRYFERAGARVVTDGDWQLNVEERGHTGLRLANPLGRVSTVGRPVRTLLLLREAAALCGREVAAAEPAAGPERAAPAPRHGRILVAEDHPTNRRVIRQQLERLGFQADIVEDGHQALAQLTERTYAALLTDLHMPGLDGIGLTKEIRAREANEGRFPMPIIGLTADVLPAAVDRCHSAGMSDVLRKPVAMGELGSTLTRWITDATPGPAIDRKQLAEVLGTADATVVRETLDEFIRIGSQHLTELVGALREADVAGVQRIAHRMSGAARTVGAGRLADAARALERAAQQGRPEHLPELHGLLCAGFEAVRREVEGNSAAA